MIGDINIETSLYGDKEEYITKGNDDKKYIKI